MRYLFSFIVFISTSAYGVSDQYVKESIKKAADEVGVPVKLLDAICFAESRHDPYAYAFGDGGAITNHAFGACQVLYNTARDYGFKDTNCEDDFRYRKQDRVYSKCKLFGPYTNAYYAALYLKKQLDRYSGSWINAIAAYNSGSVFICKTGWVNRHYKDSDGKKKKTKLYKCEKGGLLNQRYVDRVLHAFLERSNRDDSGELSEIQRITNEKEKQRALIEHLIGTNETQNTTRLAGED